MPMCASTLSTFLYVSAVQFVLDKSTHVESNCKGSLFSPGAIDTFKVKSSVDLMPVSSITICHDDSGLNSDWFVEKVGHS